MSSQKNIKFLIEDEIKEELEHELREAIKDEVKKRVRSSIKQYVDNSLIDTIKDSIVDEIKDENKRLYVIIKELQNLKLNPRHLTREEYQKRLYEIRHLATVEVVTRCYSGQIDQVRAPLNLLEKVHWMIDSMEGRKQPATAVEVTHRIAGEAKKEMQAILGTPDVADELVKLEQALLTKFMPNA